MKVGQRLPQLVGEDGVFLHIGSTGIQLLCRMARPTKEERDAFKSGQPVNIGMTVLNGILVWTVGFGSLETMDCTYSPQIERDPPQLDTPGDGMGYALTVILADALDGEILSIRLIGLPHDFSVTLKELYDGIRTKHIDYRTAISAVYAYSSEELDSMATARCVLMGG